MWSGDVHRVYTSRRTTAAETQLDARQESAVHPTELDSGLRLLRFGIVTRNRFVSGASGFSCLSLKCAGTRKICPGVRLAFAQLRFPVRQQTIANCPSGVTSQASSRFHFRTSNKRSLISNSPSGWISCGCTSLKSIH